MSWNYAGRSIISAQWDVIKLITAGRITSPSKHFISAFIDYMEAQLRAPCVTGAAFAHVKAGSPARSVVWNKIAGPSFALEILSSPTPRLITLRRQRVISGGRGRWWPGVRQNQVSARRSDCVVLIWAEWWCQGPRSIQQFSCALSQSLSQLAADIY